MALQPPLTTSDPTEVITFTDIARDQLVFSPRPDGKISNPAALPRVHFGITQRDGARFEMDLVDNGAGALVPSAESVISGIETEGSDATDPFSGSNNLSNRRTTDAEVSA